MLRIRNKSLTTLAAALTLVAWSSVPDPLKLAPESRLWVDGTSTVRSFTCKATVVDAVAETGGENAIPAVLGGENAVRAVTLTVATDKMDCGNGTMNGHMWKAIKSKDNPTITFKLDSYTLGKGAEATAATMKGSLTLGGVTKPITLAATLSSGANGTLRVAGVYELNMKDYDLTPPTLMLGTLKVRENVKVNFDLALR
jgi:polyisoprenoid-binding protein YceI